MDMATIRMAAKPLSARSLEKDSEPEAAALPPLSPLRYLVLAGPGSPAPCSALSSRSS